MEFWWKCRVNVIAVKIRVLGGVLTSSKLKIYIFFKSNFVSKLVIKKSKEFDRKVWLALLLLAENIFWDWQINISLELTCALFPEVFYVFDNSVFSFIRPFKGGNSNVPKEIVLFVKGLDPESKAEDINGNTYKQLNFRFS